MSWREETNEERDRVAASTIGDGEWVDFEFEDDGTKTETSAGEAVEFQVTYAGAQDGAEPTDMNGEALADDGEYILLTSSSRLLNALKDVADNLNGETIRVSADGGTDSMHRTYDAELQ